MSRISSVLVILCFIFLSRRAVRESTGELQINTNVDETSIPSHTDAQLIPPSSDVDVITDASLGVQTLPQEPYPQIVEDLDNDDDDLMPPTSTVDNLHFLGMGAGGASAAAAPAMSVEDINSMDYTAQGVDYTADSTGADAVSKTDPTNSDIETTKDEESSPPNAFEGSQATVKVEGITSIEAAKDSEPTTEIRSPVLGPNLDDILQTQIYDADRVSYQLPSTEGDSYVFDGPLPTEALKSVNPGTWESLSNLPVGVDGLAVDPQSVGGTVVPTLFSVDDEDGKKKIGEEDFPTFDKWSMQYLAEQEKEEIKKKQEQTVKPGTLQVQKKLKRNFAARSCGAKVAASNAEAENVNFVLNTNPDEYMISPCKAKKWFVVELCEPVQIHKIELGTTELFSSLPKSFRASASQRFPTKEWIQLGKFDMPRERKIQSFNTQLTEEFVKFVRVEMLEHHGDEYYCPITTFRILGVDMASDDEDDENDNEVSDNEDETTADEEDEMVESANLFISAKDTVVKLVKKVLYQGQQKDDGKEGHVTADNATGKAVEKKADAVPCAEKSKVSIVEDVPTVHMPDAGLVSSLPDSKEAQEVPIITKLADTEQLPMVTIETPIVIKLDKEKDAGGWDYGMYDSPDLCIRSPWSFFVQMTASASSTCPVRPKSCKKSKWQPTLVTSNPPSATDKVIDQTASVTIEPSDKQETQQELLPSETHLPSQDDSAETDRTIIEKKDMEQKSSSQSEKDKTSTGSSQRPQMQNGAKVIQTTDHQQKQSVESGITSHLTSLTSSGVSVAWSEALEPSSLLSQTEVQDVTMSLMTPDLDIQQSQVVEQGSANLAETIFLKVSPSPTLTSEDSMEADGDVLLETPTAEPQADTKPEENLSHLPLDADHLQGQDGSREGQGPSKKTDSQTLSENVTSSTISKTPKPIDLVKVGMASSAKRDTSVLKLSNRITALEQNVSMTKKYLEELSRAFKQQNEDMMKLLNKTEKRLTASVTQSEERDSQQQLLIDVLEVKVSNLTQLVESLQFQMSTMGKELRGAQFLLAFFQAILFLWLLITSYRGRRKSPLVYTDHEFLLDTMPTKPSFERTEKGSHHRRNSDIGLHSGSEPAGSALKRQVSEANLVSFGGIKQQSQVDVSDTFLQDVSQVPKKRKKKKLKQLQLSLDSRPSLSSVARVGHFSAQSPSFSSYAGVLFGTDSSSLPEGSVCVGDSTGMSSGGQEDHVLKTVRDPVLYQKGPLHQDHPYVSPASTDLSSKQGILGVRKDTTVQNVSNSAVSIASDFQDRIPLLGSKSSHVADRIQTFQYNGHRDMSDVGLANSPKIYVADSAVPVKISPEFRLPIYHKSKIRKLMEDTASDYQGNKVNRIIKGKTSSKEEFKRRRSVGFITPEIGERFFLADNYMSENRFKFLSGSPRSTSTDSELSSWKSSDLCKVSVGYDADKTFVDEKFQPQISCPAVKVQPRISTMIKGTSHYKSTSSLCTLLESPTHTFSSESVPFTAPVPLHHSATQTSFISSQNIPQTLSQLSSKSLVGTSAGQKNIHEYPPTCHSSTQTLEPGPVIIAGMKSNLTSPKSDIHLSSVTRGSSLHLDGGPSHNRPPPGLHQTHRRQGSLPLAQLRPSKSCEKEPYTRKGSFEDSKQKSSSGSLQGSSKVKRSLTNPSSISKKSFGSKVSVNDSSAHFSSSKKGP